MTQEEFNDKYSQYLKAGSSGLRLIGESPEDREAILVLDHMFSSVLTHIPRFKYEGVSRTVSRHGFKFRSNLSEIAGAFGSKLQDCVEDYCHDTSAFYEVED